MADPPTIATVLAEVGPRLKRLRARRRVTLTELAAATGISKSTLSRLETGQRKPSLELLLPIAQAHQVPLDELVGAPEVGDPRIRPKPRKRNGRIVVPLTQTPSGMHAWKVIIPPEPGEPELRIHEGHEWLYVLSGQLRLIIGDRDLTMGPGEVAEFDTGLPHWFGPAGDQPVEILSLLGRRDDHVHVRAASRSASASCRTDGAPRARSPVRHDPAS
ncbi:XRE family transcriptional regulator [Gaiella sp.]|uniref:helix-turn-helix domain-containing protein n=1 Tax=Gaiella sp. TaxID=2663207 RepID=UPI0032651751